MHPPDRSKKGSIDKDIIPLISTINSLSNYKTTSSCSGRIVILDSLKNKKNTSNWLYKTHTKANPKQIYQLQRKKQVWLLVEPLILHIKCRGKESTKQMLHSVNQCGLKRSGIISLTNWILQAESTEKMHVPLYQNPVSYVNMVTGIANEKLTQTKTKLKRLEESIIRDFLL